MSKKDVFGDDVSSNNKSQDFASMFEDSLGGVGKKMSVGFAYTAEILSISKEEAFVSTPSHQDAMILRNDLLDENKELKYKVGDKLDVVVVANRGGEIRVSRAGMKKSNPDMDSLEDAHDMELPVEGRVLEVCNGGFRVSIHNKTAFCPLSQMDYKVTDQQAYINKKFDFLITQFDPRGRNLVVSRRKLLDLQKAENEGSFLANTKAGDILNGTVKRFEKFGAFIELGGGVEGLCHISEIGWSRIQDPSEVLSLNQTVQVKVLKVEDVDGRVKISLSVKQAGGEGDPWNMVPEKFKVGSVHTGIVEKKEQYGLFVQIAPGITGLLPRAKWRDSTEAAAFENKKKGDTFPVQIDEVLFELKRISLGIPGLAEDHSWRDHSSATSQKGAPGGFTTNKFGNLASLMQKNGNKK
ncbi:S1 RNA-binding domain-containing protein [Pseudobdellovibrio sp. HCB154]|uniref:S1 RNA-binding domain-containing protein n=1 Tax=Pseudobdellovibrio sp. HCB154 TaxID=3386277 RepID=UPI003917486E